MTRTVEIRPPSVRAETMNVLKASGAVLVIVAAYLFMPMSSSIVDRRSSTVDLLPYQKLVSDASPADQRTFRELQEGLLEAERIRSTSGQWPDVAELAREGIPPFAPDPTRKSSYKWTSVRQDWVTNYLGVPADSSAPAWVLVILEPAPGEPPDPAPNDETHHRLPDGTTLHVTIWNIPEQNRRSGFSALRLPQNEGWTQWVIGGNSAP
jgi:hypothetical protein